MAKLNIDIDGKQYTGLGDIALTYKGDLWSPEYSSVQAEKFTRKKFPQSIRTVYENSIIGLKRQFNIADDPGLHVGSHVIFINDQASIKECVVLFGSSFSECRLECSLLTSILCLYYQEVHFIWSTNLDYDYIRRQRPSLVISEIPERFLPNCPPDNFNVEMFGATTAEKWRENRKTSMPSPAPGKV